MGKANNVINFEDKHVLLLYKFGNKNNISECVDKYKLINFECNVIDK